MNLETDFGIKYKINFVDKELRGKTIRSISSDNDSTRAYIGFTDGTIGMIEILCERGGKPYLSIIPPPK